MKLELLSLLTKISICEIFVCHLYNTWLLRSFISFSAMEKNM